MENPAGPDTGFIHSDPRILAGKPVIRGTRLSVEFLRELVAAGWTEKDIVEAYPHLSAESVRWIMTSA